MKDDDSTTDRVALSPKQYAARMGISVRTVYRLLRSGEVPGKKLGGSWRVPASALDFDRANKSRQQTADAV